MPVIVRAECLTPEIAPDQPFVVDVVVRAVTPGQISFHFEIAHDIPYFLVMQSEPAKSIVRRRSFDIPAEYSIRFILQLSKHTAADALPTMKLTASGLDGASNTVQLPLNIV